MPDMSSVTTSAESSRQRTKLELFEFFFYVKNHAKVVILTMLAAALFSLVYVFGIATPVYEATAQLYVVNSRDSAINLSDLQIGSYLTSDYQWIFKTWEVNQQVINNLSLPYTVAEMKEMLTVENPSNTRILLITFESENAKDVAVVANEYAKVAGQYISDYMLTSKPSIISVALEPLKPVRPKKLLTTVVVTMLVGLLDLWCLFIAFLMEDKIKTSADIRKHFGTEPLSIIPVTKMTVRKRKVR